MEYALLIGVVVFLALMSVYGYMRGFVKIVLSMVAMLVTILLTTILTIPVSAIVKNTPIGEGIRESVEEIVTSAELIDTESIKELDFPKAILEPIADGAAETQETLQTYVSEALADTIIKAGTFLVLLIVIYIAIRIVISVVNLVSKLPIINGINKGAGGMVGFIQGMLFIWIACLVLAACSDKVWAQEAFRQINDNQLLSFIYNNNVIILLVAKVL